MVAASWPCRPACRPAVRLAEPRVDPIRAKPAACRPSVVQQPNLPRHSVFPPRCARWRGESGLAGNRAGASMTFAIGLYVGLAVGCLAGILIRSLLEAGKD